MGLVYSLSLSFDDDDDGEGQRQWEGARSVAERSLAAWHLLHA